MPYTTFELVQAALARSADELEGTGAVLPQEVVEEYIGQADQEIDGKLTSVYSTPFNPVPPLIEQISTAIAAYLADLTFREVRDYQSELNPVILRYKRAQDLLKQLAGGQMDLPGVAPSDSQTGGGMIVASFNPNDTLFCDSDFDLRCYQRVNQNSRPFPSSEWWGIW